MKKRTIAIITILFSIMLLGIIAVQAWWIKRSVKLSKEQFNAAVYRSLESVVRQTEEKENYKFIQKDIGVDSIIKVDKKHIHRDISRRKNHSVSISSLNSVSTIDAESHNGKTVIKVESNKGDSGTYAMTQAYVIGDDGDDENKALMNIDTKVSNLDTLIEKMLSLKQPDSVTIAPADIKKLIKGQFVQNNLPDTFNFALVKDSTKYIYKSAGFTDTVHSYKTNLYPNDIFGRNILLYVSVPSGIQLHSSVWWAFALSVLFTLTLLFLFIYSIKMLIAHKNLLAAKNDFINHMSHELKTPLAGISLGADMIMEKADKMSTEQITKVAHSIKEQSNRLHKDMSTVLLSAMVDEAPVNVFQPFNIIDSIKTALKEFESTITERNANIETYFGQEVMMVNGDEILWRKVFSNLIDNALKFSPANPHIVIKVAMLSSNKARIEFTDNGIGISADELPHVFEKFYRSSKHRESNIQGFGLGLSFVKKVVDMHNAFIKAESAGNGTTITLDVNLHHG